MLLCQKIIDMDRNLNYIYLIVNIFWSFLGFRTSNGKNGTLIVFLWNEPPTLKVVVEKYYLCEGLKVITSTKKVLEKLEHVRIYSCLYHQSHDISLLGWLRVKWSLRNKIGSPIWSITKGKALQITGPPLI